MICKAYGLAQQSLVNSEIDFIDVTVKVMLCTSTYVPNQDTHRYKSDVTAEVTGTGYEAGGRPLTGKTLTYDAVTNTLKLSCNNVQWASSTITARYAVWYLDTLVATTSPLLLYWDFEANVSSLADAFNLTIAPGGLLTLQAA